MTLVKVVKIPKLFKKKEDKSYPLTELGKVKMEFNIRQAKLSKINGYTSLVIIVGFCLAGLLSKELMLIILANKGIGKITSLMVG